LATQLVEKIKVPYHFVSGTLWTGKGGIKLALLQPFGIFFLAFLLTMPSVFL
jgi:hypothetical protein